MAEEALGSTSLKANFHRLTRLLMRGGVNLLRETFDFIHSPADLPLRLADPAIQVQLRGARLTQPERACLYPSPGMYGKSNDFDITLIFKLLRTICNLTPPLGPRGWDDLPNSSDHTLVADLVRIKYYRNEIHGHRHSMEISDTEFVRLWEEISEALLRIAANISPAKRDEWKKSIDDLLCKPLTPNEEICIEELETWYMQDLEVKNEMVKLREDMGSLRDTTAAVLVILLNVLGHNQAAGSELLLPVPEQAERADDPEANNPLLPEPEQAAGADDPEPNNPPDIDVWDVILSFKESADLFLRYLSSKLHLLVRNKGKGSWHITVECSSSRVLEGLWEDYRSGHLNSVAQEMLITPQVLEKLGRTELKLKTFISEDQYEKGKKLLKASSGAEDESETQSAFQATITKAFSEGSIEPDLPARISTLERENVELKEKVKAIQGNFQSERDLLGRISTLERENVELNEKVKAIQGIFESERDLLARISTLERENVKVEEKVKAAIERIFQSEIVSKMERENIESGRSEGAKKESRRFKVLMAVKRMFQRKRVPQIGQEAMVLEQEHIESEEAEEESRRFKDVGVAMRRRSSLVRKLSKHRYQPSSGEDSDEQDEIVQEGGRWSIVPTIRFKASNFQDPKEDDDTKIAAKLFKVVVQPKYQEQREGSRVEFKCNISGETEARYQWFKDDSTIQGQRNSSLVLDPVKVEDFGNYKCEVKYDDGDSEKCVTSLPAELDVILSDGMNFLFPKRLKTLRELSFYTKERVALLLENTIPGIGGWREVAHRYGMNKDLVENLETKQDPGTQVMDFLQASKPDLQVYSFCKTLKENNCLNIVKVLEGELVTW